MISRPMAMADLYLSNAASNSFPEPLLRCGVKSKLTHVDQLEEPGGDDAADGRSN
jgi:hypothetical protein